MTDIVENLISDLTWLRQLVSEPTEEHDLRRASAILRRIIVEDELSHGFRKLNGKGDQVKIECTKLIWRSQVRLDQPFLIGSGNHSLGMSADTGYFYLGRTLSSSEIAELHQNVFFEKIQVTFSQYKRLTAIVFGKTHIPKWKIVRFVANEKGGAHSNPRTPKDELERIEQISLNAIYDFPLSFNGARPLYVELWTIINDIVKSPSVRQMIEKVGRSA